MIAAGYVAFRFVPGRSRSEPAAETRPEVEIGPRIGRILIGLAIDVAIVLAVAGAVAAAAFEVLRVGEPDGFTDVAVLVGVLGVVYVLITRLVDRCHHRRAAPRDHHRQTLRRPREKPR